MFERPQLLWLLLLLPLVGWSGWVLTENKIWSKRLIFIVLRSSVLALLVLLLAGPEVTTRKQAGRLHIVALLDESLSIDPSQISDMKRRVLRLAGSMNERDTLTVVAFGADTRLLATSSREMDMKSLRGGVNREATDIASALTFTMGIFEPESEKKIWLLTDGNETRGDAAQEIPSLIASGIQVYATLPASVDLPRVSLVALSSPDIVRANFVFPLRFDIQSEANNEIDARLSIKDSFGRTQEHLIKVRRGLNRYALPYVIPAPRACLVEAVLHTGPEVRAANASLVTGVTAFPPPRVLLVSNDDPTNLLRVLNARGYQVESVKPDSLKPDVRTLLKYQAIILDDVSAETLNQPLQEALKSYVSDYGGGLIVTGNTLRDIHFKGSTLESVLPIYFKPQPPPPQREPVAIYLLIDRSNSMGYNSRYPTIRDEERIRYAKQAALALLRQLDDADFVGVIAFDSDPYVLMPLQPLGGHRRALEARIASLEPGGGTDFKQALEIAERQILAANIRTRQVILLTDGDTNREYHDHDQLMADFARQNIPVSTIRIGPDTENLKLLQDFAELTHGVFYRVDDITTLPELLVKLSHRTTDARTLRHLRVTVGKRNAIVTGIQSEKFPSLQFFALSDAKERATVALKVEHDNGETPLLVAWQYGLGRTSVFAADPDSVGSVQWLQWDRYVQFWSQLVTWTMRVRPWEPFELKTHVEPDGSLKIIADKNEPSLAESLFCRIVSPKRAFEIPMTPISPVQYESEAQILPVGEYTAYLIQKHNDQEQTLAVYPFAVTGIAPSTVEELRIRPPNRELLDRLTRATGGSLNPSTEELLKHTGRKVIVYRPATAYLAPIVILLFLAEIYFRRHVLAQ